MGHLIDRPISGVRYDSQGLLRAFVWNSRTIPVVQILDEWDEAGMWWREEHPKRFWRVQDSTAALYELYQLLPQRRWFLYRIED